MASPFLPHDVQHAGFTSWGADLHQAGWYGGRSGFLFSDSFLVADDRAHALDKTEHEQQGGDDLRHDYESTEPQEDPYEDSAVVHISCGSCKCDGRCKSCNGSDGNG